MEDLQIVGCLIVLFFEIVLVLGYLCSLPKWIMVIVGIPPVLSALVGLGYTGPFFLFMPLVIPIFGVYYGVWRLTKTRVHRFYVENKKESQNGRY